MARQIVLTVAVVALLATLFVATESARTCVPKGSIAKLRNTAQDGFNVCLFNKTGNVITNGMQFLGNYGWELEKKMNFGECVCNQDCSPPQIVCKGPIDLGIGNYYNGVSNIVYGLEAYQFYCYCPGYLKPEEYPCSSPAIPSQCPADF